MDTLWHGSLIIALFLVAVLAGAGFNRPSWARSFTTAARYRWAIGANATLYVVTFLLLYAILRRVSPWWEGTEPTSHVELIWYALAATLCLRAVPRLARRPRAWLQSLSGVPSQAQQFGQRLADAKWTSEPKIENEAKTILVSRGIDSAGDWLPLAQPAHRLLQRTTELFIKMRDWENEPRFATFSLEAKNDFDSIRQRFDRMVVRVSRTLGSIERIGELKHILSERAALSNAERVIERADEEINSLLRRLVGDMIADVCEDISVFHRDACVLAARGILTSAGTSKSRKALTQRLGFAAHLQESASGYGMLVYTALLLYVGMWVFFLILPNNSVSITLSSLVMIVTLNVTGATAIAILPKMHWGFANAGLRQKAPVGFVIGAGIAAMLFAASVNLAAGAILIGGWHGARLRFAESWIYLPALFLTAAALAWLVQDHRWSAILWPPYRRLCDAAFLGSVWVTAAPIGRLLPTPALDRLFAWQTLAAAGGSLVIGAVLGYLLPESVRRGLPGQPIAHGHSLSEITTILTRAAVAATAHKQASKSEGQQQAVA
jgi:hypothetical protein